MRIPTESCRQIPKVLSRLGALALTGLLVLLSLLAVGCRTSLGRMAQKEIEKRPVSRVYLSGLKYFEDSMNHPCLLVASRCVAAVRLQTYAVRRFRGVCTFRHDGKEQKL